MLDKILPERVLRTERAQKAMGRLLVQGGQAWFFDVESPYHISLFAADELLCSKETQYQRFDVIRSKDYGLCMILDGRIQLAESDEWIYHELLIHPACILHGDPRTVALLGGGDGCAARELLKYPGVQDITVVDIDEEVVVAFRDRFTMINRGALRDPRVTVVCEDALSWLDGHDRKFDVIICDLTEPFDPSDLAGELSLHLYTPEFYRLVLDKLNPEGIFVCQTGGILYQPTYDRYHLKIVQDIRDHFPHTAIAYEFVPSFSELWSITLAARNPLEIRSAKVDKTLVEMGIRDLCYYDGTSHDRAFCPPRYLRE